MSTNRRSFHPEVPMNGPTFTVEKPMGSSPLADTVIAELQAFDGISQVIVGPAIDDDRVNPVSKLAVTVNEGQITISLPLLNGGVRRLIVTTHTGVARPALATLMQEHLGTMTLPPEFYEGGAEPPRSRPSRPKTVERQPKAERKVAPQTRIVERETVIAVKPVPPPRPVRRSSYFIDVGPGAPLPPPTSEPLSPLARQAYAWLVNQHLRDGTDITVCGVAQRLTNNRVVPDVSGALIELEDRQLVMAGSAAILEPDRWYRLRIYPHLAHR